MRILTILLASAVAVFSSDVTVANPTGIVTRLRTDERVVALTFDACEAAAPAHLDTGIVSFLVERRLPFTIFATGNFVRDNGAAVRDLSRHPGVTIENHSDRHVRDMTTLSDEDVRTDIEAAARRIEQVTGAPPRLFRFPGGHADDRVVSIAQSLGYEVVHWRWAEGDPDPSISADQLVEQTLSRTRPGDILIFHINGRGWHTAEAMPRIVEGIEKKGYRFVALGETLRRTTFTPTTP